MTILSIRVIISIHMKVSIPLKLLKLTEIMNEISFFIYIIDEAYAVLIIFRVISWLACSQCYFKI